MFMSLIVTLFFAVAACALVQVGRTMVVEDGPRLLAIAAAMLAPADQPAMVAAADARCRRARA